MYTTVMIQRTVWNTVETFTLTHPHRHTHIFMVLHMLLQFNQIENGKKPFQLQPNIYLVYLPAQLSAFIYTYNSCYRPY